MAKHRRPRLRLRHILFLAFLLVGIVPMLVSSFLLVSQNRTLLQNQERDLLVNAAVADSQELTFRLVGLRKQLVQVGVALGRDGEPSAERVARLLSSVTRQNPEVWGVTLFGPGGEIGTVLNGDLPQAVQQPVIQGYELAQDTQRAQYGFVELPGGEPVATVAVPVLAEVPRAVGHLDVTAAPSPAPTGLSPTYVVEAVVRLASLGPSFRDAGSDDTSTALIDAQGRVMWSRGLSPGQRQALTDSPPVRSFVMRPLGQLQPYPVEVDGEEREMLVRIAPIEETGWALVAQRPLDAAFQAADRLVVNTLMASLLVVLLALVLAAVAARRVSGPVQRLATTSHEIAAGNFGQRVEVEGLTWELAELADDFNRMSGHVERYVEELKRAAQANRELFIGSLRAFAAAIDAKDPYTRGHSERVASLSRTIARFLNLPEDEVHRVWIAALLHDVGKIGIDDRVLKKGGVLTDDEFAQMKLHTVIGAEILQPIVDLREMLPAVRWHHENWNGRGYPDGLKGEQIPLPARIVAVADTFDAITTNRPYQQAYTLDDAVATMRRLVGSRFDAKVVTAFLRAYEKGEVRLPKRVRGEAAPPSSLEIGSARVGA